MLLTVTRSTMLSTVEKPIEANLLTWTVHCLQDRKGEKIISTLLMWTTEMLTSRVQLWWSYSCGNFNLYFMHNYRQQFQIFWWSNCWTSLLLNPDIFCLYLTLDSSISFKKCSEIGILPWMNFQVLCAASQMSVIFFLWEVSKRNFRIICLFFGHTGSHNCCTSSWEVHL